MHHIIIINANILYNYSHSVLEFELVIEIVYIIIIYFLYTTLSYIRRYTDTRTTCSSYAFPPLPLTNLCPWDYHYKTNSRVIRRIIRFGLVLELSGLVVRTIWLIVRIISSP